MAPSFSSSSRSIPRGIIRDIAFVAIGILVIWLGLYAAFGMTNPFYVVASGSMVPELQVFDVLVVQGRIPFEDLEIGDIIVFDRPSDHNRVIVHRIVSVIDDDPKTLRTQGDANRASIPGTDFPITEAEYIGKVQIVIPEVGYVTQALKPPVNYIIIAIIIGVMISKQLFARRERQDPVQTPDDKEDKIGEITDDDNNSIDDPKLQEQPETGQDDASYYTRDDIFENTKEIGDKDDTDTIKDDKDDTDTIKDDKDNDVSRGPS